MSPQQTQLKQKGSVLCTLKEKTKHIEPLKRTTLPGVFLKCAKLFADAINTAEKDRERLVKF